MTVAANSYSDAGPEGKGGRGRGRGTSAIAIVP